jgi:hypothetical protein
LTGAGFVIDQRETYKVPFLIIRHRDRNDPDDDVPVVEVFATYEEAEATIEPSNPLGKIIVEIEEDEEA